MYLFCVKGNLAYGKIGLLNLRVYIFSGSTTLVATFFTFFSAFLISASIIYASISAFVLLFLLAGASYYASTDVLLSFVEADFFLALFSFASSALSFSSSSLPLVENDLREHGIMN
jgi:hypothetical protein